MPAPPVRTIRSIVAMMPLLLVTAACASDPPAPPPAASAVTDPPTTTTTEPATTTTAAPKTVEDEVAAAYLTAEDAFFAAFADPADDSIQLSDYWTGAELKQLEDRLEEVRQQGHMADPASKAPAVSVVRVTVTGSTASLSSCVIDPTIVIDRSTGDVVNDRISSTLYLSALTLDGSWRVSEVALVDRWNDGGGCER